MGGYQVPERGPTDDGYDEDGYDESQRAEILEATRVGPGDGTIVTDLSPDLGEDPDESDDLDAIEMAADELGEEDEDAESDERNLAEDALQEDFEDDVDGLDDELGDGDAVALRP